MIGARASAVLLSIAGLALAACSGSGTPQVAADARLDKPTRVYVGPIDAAPDLPSIDPALAVRLKRDYSGLTDDAAQVEALSRFGVAVTEALVATLRSGGLEAAAGGGERLQASDIGLMINGKLKPDDSSAASRGRRPGAGRLLADYTLYYYANTESAKPVLSFVTEAETVGQSPASARTSPQVSSARLSPEVDAAARRIGRSAGERVLAFAVEKGWIKTPASAPRR